MIYHYPDNKQSKAVWVLDAIAAGKPTKDAGVLWGLAGKNFELIKDYQKRQANFYFTDMPYWNRWMGDRDRCSWRIIPNALHCNWVNDYPDDRFKKLSVTLYDWRQTGNHILVCPSSLTIERFYGQHNWTNKVIEELKHYTDRPIKIRNKPRNAKTSGPLAADIPFEEDVKNAWAVVTLVSIAGVEAACLGIPVFCSEDSPCAPIGNLNLSDIEQPLLNNRNNWVNTLAYYQYTEAELKAGITI